MQNLRYKQQFTLVSQLNAKLKIQATICFNAKILILQAWEACEE